MVTIKYERDMVGGKRIVKTICSICFEDLKPFAQDLQAISICGHVFHEPWSLSLSLSLNIIIMNVSYYIYKCMSWKMNSQNMELMFLLIYSGVCVLDSIVYNSGSSTAWEGGDIVALYACKNVQQKMSVASTFNQSRNPTIPFSPRMRKIPKTCAAKFRDWRTRMMGLALFSGSRGRTSKQG